MKLYLYSPQSERPIRLFRYVFQCSERREHQILNVPSVRFSWIEEDIFVFSGNLPQEVNKNFRIGKKVKVGGVEGTIESLSFKTWQEHAKSISHNVSIILFKVSGKSYRITEG